MSDCNDDDNETSSNIAGTWSGTVSSGSTLSMNLTQSGQTVTGTYSLTFERVTDTGTVEGTFSGGQGTLNLKRGALILATATVRMSGNIMTGNMTSPLEFSRITKYSGSLSLTK